VSRHDDHDDYRFMPPDNADDPCGTTARSAVLPPSVHIECSSCKEIIVNILRERQPPPPPPPAIQPPLFDGAHPRRLRE